MKEIVFAIGMMIAAGCTCCEPKNATTPSNDGYVPWWVEDGVPNGDGVIVR